jgi:hypothetical protein
LTVCLLLSAVSGHPHELAKRSPTFATAEEAAAAAAGKAAGAGGEDEEKEEKPVWCKFSNPFRSRVRVDAKCQELAEAAEE